MATLERVEGNLYVFNPDGNMPTAAVQRPPMYSSEQIAQRLFEQGMVAEETVNAETALDFYQQTVALNPKAAGAFVNIGTIYYHKRDLKTAEEYYRKAVKADPLYPVASYDLALIFDETGWYAQALQYYQRALELNPQYGDAHFNIAILFMRMKQGVKAIQHFRAFLKFGTGQIYLESAARQIQNLREQMGLCFRVVSMPASSEIQPSATSEPQAG